MKIELIAVGNEVVYGHTVNTNASWIARELEKHGAEVCYHTSIRDHKQDLKDVLEIALNRVDIIIFCGGLGPTKDDLTKEIISEYFGLELYLNNEALQDIKDFFKRLMKEMGDNNIKQAYFPVGSHIIPNLQGTAPGCTFEINNKLIAMFPGPPKEMQPMFKYFIKNFLLEKIDVKCITEEIKVYGIGESNIATIIDDLLGVFDGVEVAPYLDEAFINIRIKGYGSNIDQIKDNISFYKKSITERLKEFVIGNNDKTIEETVYNLLKENKLTISTAESCTGGLLAGRLINNSGASNIFLEGVITYTNESKIKLLGISPETLNQFGAVSQEVACEMAESIRKKSRSDIGLATTGIAGPTGATPSKPVGLIFIAISIKENTYVYQLNLYGTRQEIRNLTVAHILQRLVKLLTTEIY